MFGVCLVILAQSAGSYFMSASSRLLVLFSSSDRDCEQVKQQDSSSLGRQNVSCACMHMMGVAIHGDGFLETQVLTLVRLHYLVTCMIDQLQVRIRLDFK